MMVKTRSCKNCGATVQLPPEALFVDCAFCDSPLVDADAGLEPVDRVVQFDLDRDRAGRLLSKHLARKLLAPQSLRRAAAPDQLQAVLVPFYVFDATTRSRWSAKVGLYWTREETYTTTENGKTVTKTRQVRETEWHDLAGSHVGQWFDHLVSASRGLPEAEANALEPFDVGRSLPWSPALAAGVQSEVPTVDHGEAQRIAAAELEQMAASTVARAHLPGDTHRGLQCATDAELEGVKLVLLPVWIAVFPTPGGAVRLLVNGQTGEVVGRIPRSTPKVVGLVASVVGLIIACIGLVVLIGGGA